MRDNIIITAFLVFMAYVFANRSKRTAPAWFKHLTGWQKVFGLIALFLAILILLNPEFLALGLLGDATFFDVLVMALSVQMLVSVKWAWRNFSSAFVRSMRWIGIPSPGLRYLIAIAAVSVGNVISSVQKFLHRMIS